jgi:hypothetical protein
VALYTLCGQGLLEGQDISASDITRKQIFNTIV